MKKLKYLIAVLAFAMCSGTAMAQGMGIYLGGKRIELKEGDKVTFEASNKGGDEGGDEGDTGSTDEPEITVTVTQDGNVEVFQGAQMTFFGDLDQYLLTIQNYPNLLWNTTGHCYFGYAAVMHIRDVVTDDMFMQGSGSFGYDHFRSWAKNSLGPNHLNTQFVWEYYAGAIAACNKLIAAIDEANADSNDRLKEYLGLAYAHRAMYYLDLARMYEYLPCDATRPVSNIGTNINGLTVPIITEKMTDEQVARATRATRSEMQAFIFSDLNKAENYLATYQRSDKRLPDLSCVYGLQARLNMWIEDYGLAKQYAAKAIAQSGATPMTQAEMLDTRNGFNTLDATAWMWGAQPRHDDQVVTSGIINWPSWMSNQTTFGYTGAATDMYTCITPSLYNSIGQGDIRRQLFKHTGNEPYTPGVDFESMPTYTSLKFRPYQGNTDESSIGTQAAYPLMRVEEMYLIQAEAAAQLNPTEGKTLLDNFMRTYRDQSYDFSPSSVTPESVTAEIFKQKRIELWGEGQTFFDIKRLNIPIDRISDGNADYIAQEQQFRTTTRPAWTNWVFVSPYSMTTYKWNLVGQENPDYSGCYIPGGGVTDSLNTYTVGFVDGIARELFYIDTPAELVNVQANAKSTGSGITLQAPFCDVIDSTIRYRELPINIDINGTSATIPRQSTGLIYNGMDVYIESTKDAEYKDGVITFPNNGIVATYGNNIRVVNSNIQTEIRMPGAGLTTCFIYRSFYQYGDGMEASVQWKDSLQCLHTRVRFTNLDEVRAVCVNPDEIEMAVSRLKNDPSYGVTVNAEGWIDVPIYATGTQMCLVYIGLLNNIIRYEYSDVPFTYPDYSLDLYLYGKGQDRQGKWNINTMYHFGPHVEKGYLVLAPKYADENDVISMFRQGTLPGTMSLSLNHNDMYQEARIPFPKQYGEYKPALLAIAKDSVVGIHMPDKDTYGQPAIYEHPERTLSATVLSSQINDDGSMSVEVSYEANDFDSAIIALLPDSVVRGNIREVIKYSDFQTTVNGSGTATVKITPPFGGHYTLAIAGCDKNGNILKDVLGASSDLEWTSLGMGKMRDLFMANDVYVDVEIQRCILDPTLFRVVRPYHALCVPGGYEVSANVCEYLQLQIVKGKFSYDFVYFPPSNTGYFHSTYGEDIYAVSPGSFQSFLNEETCAYNKVAEYQDNGLPGEITLEPMYYLMGQGGYFNKPGKEPLIDIIFPGYEKKDYSADVKYTGVTTDANGKTFAVANLTLGKDAQDVRAIVVSERADISEVAQAVLTGDAEATKVEAGRIEVPFDFEELQENKLQIIVLVVANGEVKTVESENFEYYAGGANPWKSIGTGLYTDDFLTPMFYDPAEVPTPTYEVEIMENTETPGLYRVMNPYSNSVYPYAEGDCAPDGMYLVINATDSNRVYIPKQSIGFDWGYGEMSIQSFAAYFLETGAMSKEELAAAGYFGKVENGVITLPLLKNDDNPVSALLYYGDSPYLTGSAGKFKIVLPSAAKNTEATISRAPVSNSRSFEPNRQKTDAVLFQQPNRQSKHNSSICGSLDNPIETPKF